MTKRKIILDKVCVPTGIEPHQLPMKEIYKAMEEYAKEAIAEHEAKKWHKYPDEKPETSAIYYCLIQHQEDKTDADGETYQLEWQTYEMVRYYADHKEFYCTVIAWQHLPEYKPE